MASGCKKMSGGGATEQRHKLAALVYALAFHHNLEPN